MVQIGKRAPAAVARPIVGLCALFLAASSARANEDIAVDLGNCSAGVHLVARDAPLPDVLKRLADALGFQLELQGNSDSIIDVDVRKQAPELVANISEADNLSVALAGNDECPGEYRVVKVWLLPKGARVPRRAVQTVPIAVQATEEQKRQRRESENVYRLAHGMAALEADDPAQ